jgi:signal transduction histidine kinase/sugar lactone lactonase YvrE
VDQSLDLAVGNRLDFLLASRNGGYWRLADGHIQKCRTNQIIRDFGPYPWGNTNVTAACEDREGNLLVGTKGAGVFWFDDKGNFQPLSTSDGLSHNYILSLLVDREGTLWVGTDGGGLNRIRQQVFEVLEGTGGLVVQSVSADEQGGLWFGCNSGEVLRWTNGPLQRFRTTQTPIEPSVRGILVDLNQQIWVGTVNWGLLQFRNGRFVRMPGPPGIQGVVQAMHEDRQGRLWFGTQAGLYCWDGRAWKSFNNGLSSGVVRALADDAQGNLWVGTLGGGLQVLRDDQFTSYLNADALPSKSITSLYVDGEGTVWVGTDGGGLARFGQGKWTRYRKREGLISNNLSYILEDGQGYLWIGSNAGLIRASKQALNDFARGLTGFIPFRTYGRPDGLPTAECTRGSQPAACRTRDGKLWFPTTKGLAWVDPAKFSPNTNPPPVVIDSVMIEGQEQISYSAGALPALVVPPSQERVEFHYASLNLGAPERARFKYRLEGHETAWTEAGNERVVRYTKLPPGHYHFQVTACNEDGVWNESGTSLPLTIEPPPPPFWRTWWFISLSSACLLGTIVAGVHRVSTKKLQRQLERLRQQEALEKERARIARDIHDQLGASLTQVALLGEFVEGDKDSPAEVEAHARQICQTARDTTRVLDEIVWTVNPSNDTLEGLVNYICKYAQDYLGVAGLRYRLDIPAQLPGRALPPELRHIVFLAAKEAITNIVRHSKASAAKVRLHLEPAAFILEIEDNGRGVGDLDQNKPLTRNGLRNMRKRMEEIGGRFSIDQAAEGGAIVRLTAPLGGNSSSKPHPSGSRRHESETEPI